MREILERQRRAFMAELPVSLDDAIPVYRDFRSAKGN